SSRRRHTRFSRDWSSDVCSSDLGLEASQIGTFRFAVEKAHALVDKGDQVEKAIGNGGVGADALPVGQLPPQGCCGQVFGTLHFRSEERRVGKEGGYGVRRVHTKR